MHYSHKGYDIIDLEVVERRNLGLFRWKAEFEGRSFLFPTLTAAKAAIDRYLAKTTAA